MHRFNFIFHGNFLTFHSGNKAAKSIACCLSKHLSNLQLPKHFCAIQHSFRGGYSHTELITIISSHVVSANLSLSASYFLLHAVKLSQKGYLSLRSPFQFLWRAEKRKSFICVILVFLPPSRVRKHKTVSRLGQCLFLCFRKELQQEIKGKMQWLANLLGNRVPCTLCPP